MVSYFTVRLILAIGLHAAPSKQHHKDVPVSILVAMKNEEDNVRACLSCLLNQAYDVSLYEIIMIDDRSEDKTYEIAREISKKHANLKVVRTEMSPDLVNITTYQGSKKQALKTGIGVAGGDILLFTDADCRPGPHWIRSMVSCFGEDIGVVLGHSPNVGLENSIAAKLAYMDSLNAAYLAAAAAGVGVYVTCNGRNLAYRRIIFDQIQGFSKISHSLSGDDDLLVHEVIKNTSWQFVYCTLNESFVPSYNHFSLVDFFIRKIRHVSASKYYPLKIKLFYSLLYVLTNYGYLFIGISLLSKSYRWWLLGFAVILKILADLLYFKAGKRLFDSSSTFYEYLLYDVVQSLYGILIFPFSRMKSVKWSRR